MSLFPRMRTRTGLLVAFCLAASCSPSPQGGTSDAEWELRNHPAGCVATRHGRLESVAFIVAVDPQNSGMVISSAAMKRFKSGQSYRRARLLVNGKRIEARPFGATTADGMPALIFYFDPAPILSEPSATLDLAATFGGLTLYSASLDDAGPGLRKLGQCAAKLPPR